MDPIQEEKLLLPRRHFFGRMATGVGAAALGSLLNPGLFAALADDAEKPKGRLGAPHFAPKAKRVIYLFMAGGTSRVGIFAFKTPFVKICAKLVAPTTDLWRGATAQRSWRASQPDVRNICQ